MKTEQDIIEDNVLRTMVAHTAVLTLNAPSVRNACSVEMREQLLELVHEASADQSCRVIIITGAGGNFSTGGRLSTDLTPNPERTRRNVAVFHEIVRVLHAGPKPTIAAVEGFAYGAGLSIAAACDHVVAGSGARFSASFVKVGLMADAGLAWTLPARVGAGRAREMLLTGREVRAEEALTIGLVEKVAEAGNALDTALALAQSYLRVAPLAVAATKRVLGGGHSCLDSVLQAESCEQPQLTLSQDYAEGRTAFREKRAPVFAGI